jgi:RNase H-like domain found in reverse transcriptase
MTVGFILSQMGDDGKRYLSRYGSITWNEMEQKYSQAKLELYGLFQLLKATQTFIIGMENFIVEVDAKYIKGIINNPNIQPNATINRWIAGVLLFDFKLRHVSAKDHAPADGLSRRPRSQEDPEEVEEVDDWIN